MFKISNTLESIFGLTDNMAERAWNNLIKEDAYEAKKGNEIFIGEIGNLIINRIAGSEKISITNIN